MDWPWVVHLPRSLPMVQFESTICGNAVMYLRYMDDIIFAIETNNIDSHLTTIKSIYPKLTFTHEIPKHGSLPFLDMEIDNTNGD